MSSRLNSQTIYASQCIHPLPSFLALPGFRVQAPDKSFVYQMSKPEVTLGRDLESDLCLDDPRVSRRHALLRQTPQGTTICDLKSGNGTFVNNQRIPPEVELLLTNHDTIRVGPCSLTFIAPEMDRSAAPPEGLRPVLEKAPVDVFATSPFIDPHGAQEVSALIYRQELEKKERILLLFYELSCKLSSVFSLEEIYEKVFELLLQVTPASRCYIFRKDAQGEFQEVAARTLEACEAGQPPPISQTIFSKVARERVSVLLENAQRGGEDQPPRSLFFSPIHSVMAAPIIGRRGLLGMIYADRCDPSGAFSADDLDLLNIVAVQTGIAIDTAITYERLQREAQARANYERFLPQQIVDEILRSPEQVKLGGVRQKVTALFADIRGFTELSERCHPEFIVTLLNRYFTLASEIIFRHGGTLDKYIGDGLLALFGAPYAGERDATKAVRAAVALQRALIKFNEELAELKLSQIAVGIGINTGQAIVGYIGSENRLDYTAIGDTINTAARLEAIAQPGQIVVSESTMQAVDESFILKPLHTTRLKGKRENLRLAEVVW